MTVAALIGLLPLVVCAACLLFMCRPGRGKCHAEAGSEQVRLREEIADLRTRLAEPDRESVQSR